MPLNQGTVNPLSVLGLRKLTFIPTHFAKFTITNVSNIDAIDDWINYNLNSRYAIKKSYTVVEKTMIDVTEVGLEDPREITLLILGCPHLHNNKKEIF